MLCKNCGREMPMIGKNCPFCGASTLLSRPPQKTANTNANDETTFFIPLSEDGHADLSAFREALQGRHPTVKPEETMSETPAEELEVSQTAQAQTTQTEQQTMPLPPSAAPAQAGQQPTAPRPRTAPVQAGQQPAAPRPRTAPAQVGQQPAAPRPRTAPAQAGQQPAAPRPRTAPAQAEQQPAAPRPRTAPAQAGQQPAAPRPRTAPAQAGQRQTAPRPQTATAPAQMQSAGTTDDVSYETSRRGAHSRKKTAYYDPETNDIRPYRKRSLGQRIITKLCIIAALAGIVGGGIYYVRTRQPDENLVAAEKYMEHKQFDNALHAYQQALSTAKDSAEIQLIIDQLKSYQQADDFLKDKDYSSAITTLNDLKGRLTDAASPLVEAVDELLTTAQSERAKAVKTPDTSNKPDQSDDQPDDTSTNKPDDTASSDNDNDTSGNQNQTTEPTQNDDENNEEQEAAARQEELEQEKRNQQQSFSRQIGALESNDAEISSAQDAAEQLEKTSLSFEAWDTMLANLYDSLATVTSADDYAEEEQNYQQWIAERDQGAANAASEKTDSDEAQLAAAQFKQSYTKTQCYKILDKLSE